MGLSRWFGILPRSTRLRLSAALILLCGLGSAALLQANVSDTPPEGASYVMEGGAVFEVLPQDSRSYQRSLEYFGGKSSVLMTEIRAWAVGFWRGSFLALLVACATVLAACYCLYAAGEGGPDPEPAPDAADGPKQETHISRK